nr:PREDICTED: uncharacterized protein LOC105663300 [Megachile rotundata]
MGHRTEGIVCIYDPRAETEVHTDAYTQGVGAVLLQKHTDGKWHPVSYYSRKTTPEEARYHSYELEALAIVSALEKFRVYLIGIRFTMKTDCNSLKLLADKRDLNPRIGRADHNRVADALSRHPVDGNGEIDAVGLPVLCIKSKVEFLGHIVENGSIRSAEQKMHAVANFQNRQQSNRLEVRTELHTDASVHGFGVILMQFCDDDGEMYPVYFASGKTTQAEEKYPSYELEVLATVKGHKKFRTYLSGIEFKIVTDCKAFALTMKKRDLCVHVARWALLLEEFNYSIEYRISTGQSNDHVDALSRNPLSECLLIREDDGMTFKIRQLQQKDDETCRIFERVKAEQMDECMKVKTEKVVRNCIDCILAERKMSKQDGFLTPICKGEVPLDTYHIDHLGPLTSTRKGYQHILIVIDAFTKFVWFYATKSANTREVILQLEKQATMFGNPRRIISDRGAAFTSNEFQEYCSREKIQHSLITTGPPRENGQVERVNRTFIPLLTKLSAPEPGKWYRNLEAAQKFFKATPHRSIKTSPFQLFFGTCMRDDPQIREMLEEEWVANFEENRNELRAKAKEQLAKIQEENKRSFNKKRKEATMYREDDLVSIKRTQQGLGLKLAGNFLGPYRVSKVLRHNRYVVEKVGDHIGPNKTSTSADQMKLWAHDEHDDFDESSDAGIDVTDDE